MANRFYQYQPPAQRYVKQPFALDKQLFIDAGKHLQSSYDTSRIQSLTIPEYFEGDEEAAKRLQESNMKKFEQLRQDFTDSDNLRAPMGQMQNMLLDFYKQRMPGGEQATLSARLAAFKEREEQLKANYLDPRSQNQYPQAYEFYRQQLIDSMGDFETGVSGVADPELHKIYDTPKTWAVYKQGLQGLQADQIAEKPGVELLQGLTVYEAIRQGHMKLLNRDRLTDIITAIAEQDDMKNSYTQRGRIAGLGEDEGQLYDEEGNIRQDTLIGKDVTGFINGHAFQQTTRRYQLAPTSTQQARGTDDGEAVVARAESGTIVGNTSETAVNTENMFPPGSSKPYGSAPELVRGQREYIPHKLNTSALMPHLDNMAPYLSSDAMQQMKEALPEDVVEQQKMYNELGMIESSDQVFDRKKRQELYEIMTDGGMSNAMALNEINDMVKSYDGLYNDIKIAQETENKIKEETFYNAAPTFEGSTEDDVKFKMGTNYDKETYNATLSTEDYIALLPHVKQYREDGKLTFQETADGRYNLAIDNENAKAIIPLIEYIRTSNDSFLGNETGGTDWITNALMKELENQGVDISNLIDENTVSVDGIPHTTRQIEHDLVKGMITDALRNNGTFTDAAGNQVDLFSAAERVFEKARQETDVEYENYIQGKMGSVFGPYGKKAYEKVTQTPVISHAIVTYIQPGKRLGEKAYETSTELARYEDNMRELVNYEPPLKGETAVRNPSIDDLLIYPVNARNKYIGNTDAIVEMQEIAPNVKLNFYGIKQKGVIIGPDNQHYLIGRPIQSNGKLASNDVLYKAKGENITEKVMDHFGINNNPVDHIGELDQAFQQQILSGKPVAGGYFKVVKEKYVADDSDIAFLYNPQKGLYQAAVQNQDGSMEPIRYNGTKKELTRMELTEITSNMLNKRDAFVSGGRIYQYNSPTAPKYVERISNKIVHDLKLDGEIKKGDQWQNKEGYYTDHSALSKAQTFAAALAYPKNYTYGIEAWTYMKPKANPDGEGYTGIDEKGQERYYINMNQKTFATLPLKDAFRVIANMSRKEGDKIGTFKDYTYEQWVADLKAEGREDIIEKLKEKEYYGR